MEYFGVMVLLKWIVSYIKSGFNSWYKFKKIYFSKQDDILIRGNKYHKINFGWVKISIEYFKLQKRVAVRRIFLKYNRAKNLVHILVLFFVFLINVSANKLLSLKTIFNVQWGMAKLF